MKTTLLILMSLILGILSTNAQYSFPEKARDARWETSIIDRNSNALPGTTTRLKFGKGDKNGEASIMNRTLENGKSYKILFTHPKWGKNGTIKGWFPSIEVLPKNSKLIGSVGFVKPNGTPGTDGARFMIYIHYFQNGKEYWKPIVDIWKQYTGKLKSFSYDLSKYAGQKVFFELRVDAGESSGQDWAAWVYPKIIESYSMSDLINSSIGNAPQQIYPPDGKVFNHFPRKTALKWKPVQSATGYLVEIDCMHCCETGKWCADVGRTYIKKKISQTTYPFEWVGAQEGRWRVTALFPPRSGKRNKSSAWRTFSYTK